MYYIKKTAHFFQHFLITICSTLVLCSLVFLTTPIQTQAATITGQAQTFTACDVAQLNQPSQQNMSEFFSGCLTSILNFVVIIALIALVIRIVVLSIGNTLPGANSQGQKELRQMIQDTILGILFLGGAALFLSPLNPVFNSVNVFDLPQPGQTQSQSSIPSNSSNPTEQVSTPTTEQCELAQARGENLANCT